MALIWFDDGSQGILKRELLSVSHYEYGEAFFGSYKGMRYRIAREPLANVHYTPVDKRPPAVLRVTIWPEPFNYTHTDPALMESRDFPYKEYDERDRDEEGHPMQDDVLGRVADYLNEYYKDHMDRWPEKGV